MSPASTPLFLNGSHGEGGAALFRTALVMSALTQQPVRIHNVRGGTRRPGLSSEDLTFVDLLAKSVRATVTGAELSGNDLTFEPQSEPQRLQVRTSVGTHEKGTAYGNALIILSSLLPVLARTGAMSKVIVEGETYNPNTLTFDAFERASLALHRMQGVVAHPHLELAGFGAGNYGEVSLEIEPSALQGFRWASRGALLGVQAVLAHSGIPSATVERGASHVSSLLQSAGLKADVSVVAVPSKGPGLHLTCIAEFERGLGVGQAAGQRGTRIETVGAAAVENLLVWLKSEATLDAYLADQALIMAAFSDSETHFTTNAITSRLMTMAWVIKEFVPIHVTILGTLGEPGTVTIHR